MTNCIGAVGDREASRIVIDSKIFKPFLCASILTASSTRHTTF